MSIVLIVALDGAVPQRTESLFSVCMKRQNLIQWRDSTPPCARNEGAVGIQTSVKPQEETLHGYTLHSLLVYLHLSSCGAGSLAIGYKRDAVPNTRQQRRSTQRFRHDNAREWLKAIRHSLKATVNANISLYPSVAVVLCCVTALGLKCRLQSCQTIANPCGSKRRRRATGGKL